MFSRGSSLYLLVLCWKVGNHHWGGFSLSWLALIGSLDILGPSWQLELAMVRTLFPQRGLERTGLGIELGPEVLDVFGRRKGG